MCRNDLLAKTIITPHFLKSLSGYPVSLEEGHTGWIETLRLLDREALLYQCIHYTLRTSFSDAEQACYVQKLNLNCPSLSVMANVVCVLTGLTVPQGHSTLVSSCIYLTVNITHRVYCSKVGEPHYKWLMLSVLITTKLLWRKWNFNIISLVVPLQMHIFLKRTIVNVSVFYQQPYH